MAISSIFSSSSPASSGADQDLQVRTLRSKIEDWSTCPTTDPQTKKEIVGRLQVQLDALTTSIQARAKAKESQPPDQSSPPTPGLGATIDILA